MSMITLVLVLLLLLALAIVILFALLVLLAQWCGRSKGGDRWCGLPLVQVHVASSLPRRMTPLQKKSQSRDLLGEQHRAR